MTRIRPLAAFLLLTSVLVTNPAQARPSGDLRALSPTAKAHMDAGLAHHEGGRYEAAVAAFRAGFELEPAPVFLFAMAQAERLSGDCASATVYYQQFLATSPVELHAAAARKMLARCQRAIASAPTAVDQPSRAQPGAATTPAGPASTASVDEPWHRDRIATSLLAIGATSTAIGVGFLVAAHADAAASDEAADYDEFSTLASAAKRKQTIAVVAIGTGTALLSAYLLRRIWRRRRPPVSLSASPNQVGATLAVSF